MFGQLTSTPFIVAYMYSGLCAVDGGGVVVGAGGVGAGAATVAAGAGP